MFHETRHIKSKKAFRVLICVIYTIIDNFFCIDYIACQSKTLSETCADGKYSVKYFNELLGALIPDLIMNLLTCHGYTKNIKSIVVLKCPRWMLKF